MRSAIPVPALFAFITCYKATFTFTYIQTYVITQQTKTVAPSSSTIYISAHVHCHVVQARFIPLGQMTLQTHQGRPNSTQTEPS